MTRPSESALPGRPVQIKAKHLQRDAVIYVRQSSPDQVREHTGSTAVQRSLAERARQWGWPESAIKIVDDDLGLSGTSSYQRAGFQLMLQQIERDEIGLVLVHDVSRLSRNLSDAEAFLTRAIRSGILIDANGTLFDAGDTNLAELFGFRVKSLLAWWDNAHRAHSLQRAREAKVPQGHAVSKAPIGYVTSGRGQWRLDPSTEVQEAVRRVFDLYLKLKSIHRVAAYFESNHLLFPRRVRGELQWRPVSASGIFTILKSPHYSGDYVFQRRRVIPATESTKRHVLRRPPDEWLVYSDHHDPYVNRETWRKVQETLSAGRIANRQPVRDGAALLQSMIWCGVCGRRFATKYYDKTQPRHRPTYLCQIRDSFGSSRTCFSVSAAVVDPPVVERVLRAVAPPSIEEAIAATHIEIREQERRQKTHRHLLQQAEHHVEQATQRYLLVEPENRGVKRTLEARMEEKIRARDNLKRVLEDRMNIDPVVLTPADTAELVRLTQDVERIWTATTTTNADRKRLIQTLVSRVVLTATDEWIDVDLVWNGGAREGLRLLRSKGLSARIGALHAASGRKAAEIEAVLHDEGIRNNSGQPVTRHAIAERLRQMGMSGAALRIQAWGRVRELALEGCSRPEMLRELREHGPRHPRGVWTWRLVNIALRALLSGRTTGVDPLPPGFKVAVRLETSDEVIEQIVRGRQARRPWRAILDDLNAQGLTPLKARAFSKPQASALFRRLDRRGLLPISKRRRTDPGKLYRNQTSLIADGTLVQANLPWLSTPIATATRRRRSTIDSPSSSRHDAQADER